jgi:hypothetical protein
VAQIIDKKEYSNVDMLEDEKQIISRSVKKGSSSILKREK